jgi:hypothetical protein
MTTAKTPKPVTYTATVDLYIDGVGVVAAGSTVEVDPKTVAVFIELGLIK